MRLTNSELLQHFILLLLYNNSAVPFRNMLLKQFDPLLQFSRGKILLVAQPVSTQLDYWFDSSRPAECYRVKLEVLITQITVPVIVKGLRIS